MRHRLVNAALIGAGVAVAVVYTVGAAALWLYTLLTGRGNR